jgi:hypothetical protein
MLRQIPAEVTQVIRRGPERCGLHQHIAKGGRFDRASHHGPTREVGRPLAKNGILGSASHDVDRVDIDFRQR